MRAFDLVRPHAPAAFRAWMIATLVGAGVVVGMALTGAWRSLVQTGSYSDIHVTLLAVALAWLYCGATLWALRLDEPDALVVGGACVTGLLYVNVLRERQAYGDLIDYVSAASSLYHGTHLPPRYLYSPLWATVLRGVLPLGAQAVFDVCWILNAVAVPVFFVLLVFALQRYGWPRRAALAAVAACLVVNVPVLRTLLYGQINLHVMNLLLAGLLLYPRSRALSACLFACAAHLKLSPLALAAPFLFVDRRWIAWWLVWLVALAAPTLLASGTAPFHDVIFNLRHVYDANGLTYRDTSIDSLVHSIAMLAGRPDAGAASIPAIKVLTAAYGLFVTWRHVSGERFATRGRDRVSVLLNALPALLILIIVISPLLWEHHPVFAILPFVLLPHSAWSSRRWAAFALGYAVVFLLPTYDVFPFSFARLAALVAWLPLSSETTG